MLLHGTPVDWVSGYYSVRCVLRLEALLALFRIKTFLLILFIVALVGGLVSLMEIIQTVPFTQFIQWGIHFT